jgi:ribonuclease HI
MSYYSVYKGKVPGVYKTWLECKQQTNGFSGASFKKFSTREDADKSFSSFNSFNSFGSQVLESSSEKRKDEFCEFCIYVDGAHNKRTRDEAWGSVVDQNGNDLVERYKHLLDDMVLTTKSLPVGTRTLIIAKFDDVSTQQINGAELLSLIAGIRIAQEIKCLMVCSDSKLMTDYWSKRLKPETKLKMDPLKSNWVEYLIKIRQNFEKIGGKIEKISGDDNPADLGFHK